MSNAINEDLKSINFRYLMLIRDFAKTKPLEAIWKFNMECSDIQKISEMSLEEIENYAACGRALIVILPANEKQIHTPLSAIAALSSAPALGQKKSEE